MTPKRKKRKPTRSQVLTALLIVALTAVSTLAVSSNKKVSALENQVMTLNGEVLMAHVENDQLKEDNEALKSSLPDERFSALFEKIQTLEENDLLSLEEYIDQMLKSDEEPEDLEDDFFDIGEEELAPASEISDFLGTVQAKLPGDNGSWAVYVSDLKTGEAGCIDSHSMQAASLIKLYIMGAVYENYDALANAYGAQNLDSLLNPMITVSDNYAANTLVEYLGHGNSQIGMAIVNYFCQTHGFNDTSMGRLLLASRENGDNYTSVADCGRFLTAVYEGSKDPEKNNLLSHPDAMYALLKQQTRTHKIPANLPSTVHTASKTGELEDVENDVAILYHEGEGNDLIICVMSEFLSAPGNAQSKISELARTIYDHYNN